MKRSAKALLVAMAIGGMAGAGIALALPAFAAHGCARGPHGVGFFGRGYGDADAGIDRLAERLDLSKTQHDAMRAIIDKARPQMRDLHDQLAENGKQLRALMREAKPDENRLTQLADVQGKAIAQMIVLRTRIFTEIQAVLTDEQRDRLQHWHKWPDRRGRFSSSQDEAGDATAHSLSLRVPVLSTIRT